MANLFVDFPFKAFNTDPKTNPQKNKDGFRQYLKDCDLVKEQLTIKIGDLGFSKKVQKDELT